MLGGNTALYLTEVRGKAMAGTGAQDEIRAVLDQLLEAQNAGDADRIGTALSERPDAVHIGTDAITRRTCWHAVAFASLPR